MYFLFNLRMLFLFTLFSLLIQTKSQYLDDNVVRGGEIDSDPTGPADKAEGKSNSVVVLGVTLSLSVIFAIAGILIGVYFHVERLFCCCKKAEDKASEIESGESTWYGSEKSGSTNMFMTGATNAAFSKDEGKPSDPNTAFQKANDVGKSEPQLLPKHAPRRKPFLPNTKRKKKQRETSLIVEEPVGFGSTTTHVTDDGTIVRAADKSNEKSASARRQSRSHNAEASYKSFSTQQDDILF